MAASWKIFTSQLGIRLVLASLVISSLLSVLATGLQLYATYSRETGLAVSGLDEVELALADALEQALWTFDFDQVEIVLEGLRSNASVSHVSLTTPAGQAWELGAPEGSGIERSYELYKTRSNGAEEPVGALVVEVSRDAALQTVWAQFWTVFLSNVAKAYFAAIAMLLVFGWIVTVHLRKIADHVQHSAPNTGGGELVLDRAPRKTPDDLDKIVAAIRAYEVRVQEALEGLREEVAERTVAEKRAKSAARTRNSFISTMSHEVRTPLNAILGLFHLVEVNPDATDKLKQFARVGTQAGQQLLHQLNNVLDMARLDGDGIEINTAPTNIREVAAQWHDTLRALVALSEKPIETTLTIEDDVAQTYDIDAPRVTQIITNLTDNAAKFTTSGEVALRLSDAQGRLRIEVADTGPGIPAAERARIFDRFTQIDSGIRRAKGGAGLGLAICLELAQLMGGSLRVRQDKVGRHSTVFVLEV